MASIEKEPRTGRLFFALWPDDPVRTGLRRLQRLPGPADGRRVHPQDLHLTLAFLGQVNEAQLPCVRQAADRVQGSPIALTLTRLGYWRGPRVAWAAPGDTPAELGALVDALWRELLVCGFEREARPYKPHITLARKARAFETAEPAEAIPWQAGEFVLVTSESRPEPPRYRVIGRWPLTGENQG